MRQCRTIFTLFIMVFFAGSVAYATTIYDGRVNINTATVEELMQVPYMTAELAKTVIDFRNSNGPFSSTNDLLNVEGMDKKDLEKMKNYLKFDGKTNLVRYDV